MVLNQHLLRKSTPIANVCEISSTTGLTNVIHDSLICHFNYIFLSIWVQECINPSDVIPPIDELPDRVTSSSRDSTPQVTSRKSSASTTSTSSTSNTTTIKNTMNFPKRKMSAKDVKKTPIPLKKNPLDSIRNDVESRSMITEEKLSFHKIVTAIASYLATANNSCNATNSNAQKVTAVSSSASLSQPQQNHSSPSVTCSELSAAPSMQSTTTNQTQIQRSSIPSAPNATVSFIQKNKKQPSQRGFGEKGLSERGSVPEMIAMYAINTADKYTTTVDLEEYLNAEGMVGDSHSSLASMRGLTRSVSKTNIASQVINVSSSFVKGALLRNNSYRLDTSAKDSNNEDKSALVRCLPISDAKSVGGTLLSARSPQADKTASKLSTPNPEKVADVLPNELSFRSSPLSGNSFVPIPLVHGRDLKNSFRSNTLQKELSFRNTNSSRIS